ncbi:MAG: hypothetical protein ACJAS9_002275 [Polaribacter sp.]|jgi:hypothetical protein
MKPEFRVKNNKIVVLISINSEMATNYFTIDKWNTEYVIAYRVSSNNAQRTIGVKINFILIVALNNNPNNTLQR